MNRPLLEVEGLQTKIGSRTSGLAVVRDVDLRLEAGQTLCLVGESGCGKSMTALSITRVLPPVAQVTAGRILLDGTDIAQLVETEMARLRGRRISMVFQDSMTSLNPVLTIGLQITEVLGTHLGIHGQAATDRACTLLRDVGIPDPGQRLRQYPHQLSGGLRQRAAIAVAIAGEPDVLIADEPTTALDVTTQAQILELLKRQQQERGMALMLITHDFGVVARIADTVAVMYAGRIVETGDVMTVFSQPSHPYTEALLASIPRLDIVGDGPLPAIPGIPPPLDRLPAGCSFRPRCRRATGICETRRPALLPCGESHLVACHLATDQRCP